MDVVEVRGQRIAYERTGSGPVLLLLHGVLQDSRAWRPQLAGLSDMYTLVAWEAPGCGGSSDPPEDFSLSDYADCLAGFLDGLAIDKAHVLGLSWGGGLALEFYRRHPAAVRSLVLTGAYAGWAGSLPAEVVEQRLRQAIREADLPAAEFVPGWLPGLLTDAAPEALRAEVAANMADFHPAGYRAMARGFAAADLREMLPSVRVPTLLLYGEADARAPLIVASDLRNRIPGSQLVVLAKAGHLSNVEVPDDFNREVRRFLDSLGA